MAIIQFLQQKNKRSGLNQAQIITIALFIIGTFFFNTYRVLSDANYYSILPIELLLSGFHGEGIGNYHHTHTVFQYGAAIFYLPFYLFSKLITNISLFFFGPTDFFRVIGTFYTSQQTFSDMFFLTIATNFFGLLTLLMLLQVLNALKLPKSSLFFMFLGSAFFLYAIPLSGNANIIDIFLITSIIYLLVFENKFGSKTSLILGILSALSTSIRHPNFIIGIGILVYFFLRSKQKVKPFATGLIIFSCLLFISLLLLNYKMLAPSYNGIFGPTTRATSQSFGLPLPIHSLKILVHPMHGLFLWTPITLLALNGLILFQKEKKGLSLLFLAWFVSLVLIYGYFHYWYAGWSFSQRYLIGLFPIFVIGLAYLQKLFPKFITLLAVFCCFYTLFLFLNWGTLIQGEMGIPQDIIGAWQAGQLNIDTYIRRVIIK